MLENEMKDTALSEYELNRSWITDVDGNQIGETNFVVPAKWLFEVWESHFKADYWCYVDFIDAYVPEEDGQKIYELAIHDNCLIEDLGEQYYNKPIEENHKYVVVCCCEREIYKVGSADTPSEAFSIMCKDYVSYHNEHGITDEELENHWKNQECAIEDPVAWSNVVKQIDWSILEI